MCIAISLPVIASEITRWVSGQPTLEITTPDPGRTVHTRQELQDVANGPAGAGGAHVGAGEDVRPSTGV